MENISYIGMSHQVALSQQIEVTSNNIANMSTPGFKAQNVMFLDYITQPKNGAPINQSYDYATYRDLTMGNMTQTYNPLDMAINGSGYFVVQTDEGIRYTRDGSFALNTESQLVDQSGNVVIGETGNPLVVQPQAKQITVSVDGSISSEIGDIGKLKLVSFENEQALTKIGANLYDAGNMPELVLENRFVSQGVLEGSNVNPIAEMNKMITLMRMFQATQQMLQTDHERVTGAIQKLTSVNA
ncbi:MAG: flagellar basal-body rod protein FlgF [Alphaproteobacteria bacterium]